MSKKTFTLWSPQREESSVLSFKALLSLRPTELWLWSDDARSASLWVVDAQCAALAELTQALRERKAQGHAFAALLAQDWSMVKDPIWTFFKIPLRVSHVYPWVDSALPLLPCLASVHALAGQRLRLKRWPNMTRYSASASMADSMELTLACSSLLKDWLTYEEAQAMVNNKGLLDVLLSHAQDDGILDNSPVPTENPVVQPPVAARPEQSGAWSLVKRLIQKFR